MGNKPGREKKKIKKKKYFGLEAKFEAWFEPFFWVIWDLIWQNLCGYDLIWDLIWLNYQADGLIWDLIWLKLESGALIWDLICWKLELPDLICGLIWQFLGSVIWFEAWFEWIVIPWFGLRFDCIFKRAICPPLPFTTCLAFLLMKAITSSLAAASSLRFWSSFTRASTAVSTVKLLQARFTWRLIKGSLKSSPKGQVNWPEESLLGDLLEVGQLVQFFCLFTGPP